jgi:hypothetical protein
MCTKNTGAMTIQASAYPCHSERSEESLLSLQSGRSLGRDAKEMESTGDRNRH